MPEQAPDRASLRSRLSDALRTDTELTAFCLDRFPAVAEQFSSEMSRQAKLNLLLQSEDAPDIQAKLDEHLAKRSHKGDGGSDTATRTLPFAALSIVLCVGVIVMAVTLWRWLHPKPPVNLAEGLKLDRKTDAATCPIGMFLSDGVCQPAMNKTCPEGLRFKEGLGCVARVVDEKVKPYVRSESALAETEYRPKMVSIPKGRFLMGSLEGNAPVPNQKQHWVALTQPYIMMETEVTQGQYQAVMEENPSKNTRGGKPDTRPVVNVRWYDAVKYANLLSKKEGIEECYRIDGTAVSWEKKQACKGYRLPTEAEWEYAARAGQNLVYAGSGNAAEVSWNAENSGNQTHPVKLKRANKWKLYDMTGNVSEWVWDVMEAYAEKDQQDPVGPPTANADGTIRALRGGCFRDKAWEIGVVLRDKSAPSYSSVAIGFRLVRSYH